jgi:hypothetical protein
MTQKVKLLMSWDIRPDQEASTLEFMAHELAPAIQELGITPTEAWYTVYGDQPQILVGAVSEDLETMRQVLEGPKWQELMGKLDRHIENYQQKIVVAKGRFQF